MTNISLAVLEQVTGGGAQESQYCAQTKAAGMQFGNLSAGGQVADAAAAKLFPKGAPDGFKAKQALGTAAVLNQFPSPVVADKIKDGLPAMCK